MTGSEAGLPVSPVAKKIILFVVTGGGVGYFPRFPGTMGTLLAIPFSLGLNSLATTSLLLALLILSVSICCAIWLSAKGAEIFGQKDPGKIIIDEIMGFLIANFFSPPRLTRLTLAFLFFRFFDIAKVFPASRLEKLPGGFGIVLDDVVAGLYTFLILLVISSWGQL